jgi:hypothetical protein
LSKPSKFNLPVLICGLAMLFFGINVLYRGNVWSVVLGNERYLVGGVAIVFAFYLAFLGLKQRN